MKVTFITIIKIVTIKKLIIVIYFYYKLKLLLSLFCFVVITLIIHRCFSFYFFGVVNAMIINRMMCFAIFASLSFREKELPMQPLTKQRSMRIINSNPRGISVDINVASLSPVPYPSTQGTAKS